MTMMAQLEGRPDTLSLVDAIAGYAATFSVNNDSAIHTARHCLIEALSHGFEALRDPDRASLIAPVVPGAMMPGGTRVPGTSLELDPAQGAFCLAVMFCRTSNGSGSMETLTASAAGPLAALLAVADYRARKATMEGTSPPKVRDVLVATLKAVEIQAALGSMPLALTALAATELGATQAQIITGLRYVCVDGGGWVGSDPGSDAHLGSDATGKLWATADAICRAVRHGCQAIGRDVRPTGPASASGTTTKPAKRPLGTTMIDRLAREENRSDAELLRMRFRAAVDRHFPPRQAERVKSLFAAPERLDDLPVNELLAALVTNGAR